MERERVLFNLKNGLDAMINNRFRAVLTSLGIIFGVAAVIAMLAIGNGAEKEILEQIKQIGSNNIVIKIKLPEPKTEEEQKSRKPGQENQKFSPGLSLADAENIQQTVPGVKSVSPEIESETIFFTNGLKTKGKLLGITNAYFETSGISVTQGQSFSDLQWENSMPVCLIGRGIQSKLFANTEAIGQPIKCGGTWFKVIGILDDRKVDEKSMSKLSIRNVNQEVYVPIQTFLMRVMNRSEVTKEEIKRYQEEQANAEETGESSSKPAGVINYNQLDRLVVTMQESNSMEPAVEVIDKLLKRRHFGAEDYEIVVPELLLKQEQKTRKLFNLVLAVIAGISLLVGGIGIMNIMLASVLERIKEIGLRLAIGARRADIVYQFIAEAIVISLSGGILGIILGIIFSYLIEIFADIETVISATSVVISFFVSVSVGLIFGIYPARKASQQNPIESLRYE
jgi:putative ABC transport system permease protein